MRNKIRFQEPFREHVFRLTGSPRGNVFIGFSQRRVRIMRTALRHRLNAHKPLAVGELMKTMGTSNCPYWLTKISVEELMDALDVQREGGMIVPSPSIRMLCIAEQRISTPNRG